MGYYPGDPCCWGLVRAVYALIGNRDTIYLQALGIILRVNEIGGGILARLYLVV